MSENSRIRVKKIREREGKAALRSSVKSVASKNRVPDFGGGSTDNRETEERHGVRRTEREGEGNQRHVSIGQRRGTIQVSEGETEKLITGKEKLSYASTRREGSWVQDTEKQPH